MEVERIEGYPLNSFPDLKEVCFGQERYLAPGWETMGKICFDLAKKIIQNGKEFDRLITLAKGGWTWARTLADHLALEEVASIRVRFYQAVGETRERPVIIQSLPVSVDQERILLFDDVDDTGKSLTVAKQYLETCGASEISLATLFHKPWSEIQPDFYGRKTQAWVIFPHEIRETVILLRQKWNSQGIGEDEIKKRFLEIGLNSEMVDYFLKL